MSLKRHGPRIGLLLLLVCALLGWLAAHTEVLFADGLRYVRQARMIDRGAWREGLTRAVDHPVYPVEIVLAHRLMGGDESPDAWQAAAQGASILAGLLLVVPLYLVARELFGGSSALLAGVLVFAVPLTGHVFADALSESTFLLFWTWGFWTALRFLRAGTLAWLVPLIGFSVLAYLTRPEGLLLPLALAATLGVLPFWRRLALSRAQWWTAVGLLVIAPACLIGPYIAVKGSIATKPSVARLLGTAPKSLPLAVERQHPLDPDQSAAATLALAAKAVFEAVRDAVSIPLLPMALVGLALVPRPAPAGVESLTAGWARVWLFVAIIAVASVLALVRLHATGGYCSPRHALILSFILIPAAAFGIQQTVAVIGDLLAQRLPGVARAAVGPALWTLVLGGLAFTLAPRTLAPVNEGLGTYRSAGRWLHEHIAPGSRVVDVTGWALFYGDLPGYTFGTLAQAPSDPSARWVVAREAHLRGPWPYCAQLRDLVGAAPPVMVFHGANRRHATKVLVFDRQSARPASLSADAAVAAGATRR
jgi:4-amino-4-deoxy-L-arabinose transferase-like glycosyltransferase